MSLVLLCLLNYLPVNGERPTPSPPAAELPSTSRMAPSAAASEPNPGPCAACKAQRRKCAPECLFAPYFPANAMQNFENVHRVYGASNVGKILQEVDPADRMATVESLVYDANHRLANLVYGSVGPIYLLQQQLLQLDTAIAADSNYLAELPLPPSQSDWNQNLYEWNQNRNVDLNQYPNQNENPNVGLSQNQDLNQYPNQYQENNLASQNLDYWNQNRSLNCPNQSHRVQIQENNPEYRWIQTQGNNLENRMIQAKEDNLETRQFQVQGNNLETRLYQSQENNMENRQESNPEYRRIQTQESNPAYRWIRAQEHNLETRQIQVQENNPLYRQYQIQENNPEYRQYQIQENNPEYRQYQIQENNPEYRQYQIQENNPVSHFSADVHQQPQHQNHYVQQQQTQPGNVIPGGGEAEEFEIEKSYDYYFAGVDKEAQSLPDSL